nr:unnamed protein product [Digitaria exilis]
MVWLPLFSLQFHHASHPGYGSARPAARNPAHPFPPHQALPFLSRPVASKMEAEYPHHQAGPSSATTTTTLWPYATRRRKRGEDGDDEDDLSPASVAMDLDADAQRAAVRASPPIIHPPRVTPRLELLRDYLVDRFGSCWIGWTDGCLLPVILVPGAARGFLEDWGHPVTFLRVGAGPRVWTGGEAAFRFFGWGGEEDDEFYELQPADYFNLISNRIAEQSKMLKTRKMREAELAAQRAKRTNAVMRVRFPDGYILEADFPPSERIHNLVELLMKVLARPDLPFYLYTVPPKKRILDTSQDFYTAGFVPGANIHFSYDLPEGSLLNTDDLKAGPFLREEIRSLDGLSLLLKPASQPDDSRMDSSSLQSVVPQSDTAPITNKKPGKPKWLRR